MPPSLLTASPVLFRFGTTTPRLYPRSSRAKFHYLSEWPTEVECHYHQMHQVHRLPRGVCHANIECYLNCQDRDPKMSSNSCPHRYDKKNSRSLPSIKIAVGNDAWLTIHGKLLSVLNNNPFLTQDMTSPSRMNLPLNFYGLIIAIVPLFINLI